MDDHKQTLEALLGSSKETMTEEEKSRRIEELRKQLKQHEDAESPEDEEMKGEPDDDLAQDEEHEEGYILGRRSKPSRTVDLDRT